MSNETANVHLSQDHDNTKQLDIANVRSIASDDNDASDSVLCCKEEIEPAFDFHKSAIVDVSSDWCEVRKLSNVLW